MADPTNPTGPYAPDPDLPVSAGGVRLGRYYTEAELTQAARAAVARQKGPDGSRLTQEEVARAFGVSQSVVSQALGYSRETNRQRGHALRRRILRAWGGGNSLSFAGPFWQAVDPEGQDEKGRDVADRFAGGEDPYLHTDGRMPEGTPGGG